MCPRSRELCVRFPGEGKTVYVLPGTILKEALERASIVLDYPCGGKGTCGKCKVRVTSGAPAPTDAEQQTLTNTEIDQGYRLACRLSVTADTTVEIPADSKLQSIQMGVEDGRTWEDITPIERFREIRYTFPTLETQTAYTTLLAEAFGQKVCLRPEALRDLPGFISTEEKPFFAVYRVINNEITIIDFQWEGPHLYGLAVDIGTTTLAVSLVNIRTGKTIAVAPGVNAQREFGGDYISRIDYAIKNDDGLAKLRDIIQKNINDLIETLCAENTVSPEYIYDVVISGNSVMQHLFIGVNPASLSEIPFSAVFNTPVKLEAADVSLNLPSYSLIRLVPNLVGFIGGDITAGLITSGLTQKEPLQLLIDIGTNGEIVLGNNRFLYATSAAAGPAFEGGNIGLGMAAVPGAVEKFVLNGENEQIGRASCRERV